MNVLDYIDSTPVKVSSRYAHAAKKRIGSAYANEFIPLLRSVQELTHGQDTPLDKPIADASQLVGALTSPVRNHHIVSGLDMKPVKPTEGPKVNRTNPQLIPM